ncbi:MAG TPA: peptidylprolyl isomerase, partial [Pirellulales bacterium]|nr:peptidylprolyl isomerase [Pirellulales bacterium]
MRRPIVLAFVSIAGLAIFGGSASARGAAPEAQQSKSPIAATAADEPIFAAEIDELLADTPSGRQATGAALARLKAEALEQLINRRLVFASLAKQGYQPPEDDVDELLADLKQRLTAQQLTFEEFFNRHSLTEPLVRRRLAWDAAWTRYLEQTLTDEAVEKYFVAHRRDFDGTELRVSHILLRVENLADRSAVAAAIERTEALRKEIAAGKLSFAEAAEKYSAGPSRKQGGDLGFIAR